MSWTAFEPGAPPPILYGTAWKQSRTAELVKLALDVGFRGVDTACQPKHYHEAGVGEGIAAALDAGLARADLYIQTKFTPLRGQDPNCIPYDPQAALAEQVAQSFAASLRNLRTDYLDALLLHSPLPREADTLEAWRAMEALVDSRGVRRLGLSNCYDLRQFERVYAAARVKPALLQNRFYADCGYDVELRAFCRANEVRYQSFWTLTANPHVLASDAVISIAQRLGRTPAQIFFRFLIQAGVAPLTGTKSEQHMREDLAVLDFELEADDRRRIAEVLAGG